MRRTEKLPLNPALDSLSDYPFEALRTLLNPVTPRVNDEIIAMSVGEPQHQPPALLTETLAAHAHEWNKYPPMAGTTEGLYLFSGIAVPREKAGQKPVVLCPNPYYLVYNGAATMAGAPL